MTTADTYRLRKQLLAALVGSARPMTTVELAALMPWKIERTSQGGCELWCSTDIPAGVRVVECHTTWHVVKYRRTPQGFAGIYCHLSSLERRGLVRRCRIAGQRAMFWTATPKTSATVPEIEQNTFTDERSPKQRGAEQQWR